MEREEEGNSQRESRVVDPRGVVGMKDTPGLVAGFVVGCIGWLGNEDKDQGRVDE